jgi:hypothetical protein
MLMKDVITKHLSSCDLQWKMIQQPPYSLAFNLLLLVLVSFKKTIKGCRFRSDKGVKAATLK